MTWGKIYSNTNRVQRYFPVAYLSTPIITTAQTGSASATVERIAIWGLTNAFVSFDGVNGNSASNNSAFWISCGY